jgi:hypothetical protein
MIVAETFFARAHPCVITADEITMGSPTSISVELSMTFSVPVTPTLRPETQPHRHHPGSLPPLLYRFRSRLAPIRRTLSQEDLDAAKLKKNLKT